jgi:hypothetical protein
MQRQAAGGKDHNSLGWCPMVQFKMSAVFGDAPLTLRLPKLEKCAKPL